MHRNGKKRLSRRKTQDFRAKRARKHLAEYNLGTSVMMLGSKGLLTPLIPDCAAPA